MTSIVRIAVAGTPSVAHLDALASLGLTAVCRLTETASDRWSGLDPIDPADIGGAADVLLLGGPSAGHGRLVHAACRAGIKAVVAETPFCSGSNEATAVRAVAARSRTLLTIVTPSAYDATWRDAADRLANARETPVGMHVAGMPRTDVLGSVDPAVVLGIVGLGAPTWTPNVHAWLLTRVLDAVTLVRVALGPPEVLTARCDGASASVVLEAAGSSVEIDMRGDDRNALDIDIGGDRMRVADPVDAGACESVWRDVIGALADGRRPSASVDGTIDDLRVCEDALAAACGRPQARAPRPGIAHLGAGFISQVHLPVAAALGRVVRVASRTREAAEARALPLGADATTFDDERLLDGVSAVVVAGVPATHAEHTLLAVRRGLPVLVEKPMTRTVAEARLIAEAVRASGTPLIYGENLAFMGLVQRAVALARARRATTVRVVGRWPQPTWGSFDDPAYGGGVTFDTGPHVIDLARMLLGRPPAEEVVATLEAGPRGVDRAATIEIRFARGGTAFVEIAWTVDEMRIDAEADGISLEIAPSMRLEADGIAVDVPGAEGFGGSLVDAGYAGQIEALLGTGPVHSSAEDGLAVLEIVAAAYRSAGTGRPEPLPFTGPLDVSPLELWHSAT